MSKGLRCFACAAAEVWANPRGVEIARAPRADSPFVTALALVQTYSYDRVKGALCASHQEHFREVIKIVDKMAESEERA